MLWFLKTGSMLGLGQFRIQASFKEYTMLGWFSLEKPTPWFGIINKLYNTLRRL